jgi:hypothetical protein
MRSFGGHSLRTLIDSRAPINVLPRALAYITTSRVIACDLHCIHLPQIERSRVHADSLIYHGFRRFPRFRTRLDHTSDYPPLPAPLPTEDAVRVPESELAVSEEELDVLEEEEEEEEKEADAPEEELDVLEMEVDVPEREAICTPHPTEKAARVQEQKVEILDIRKERDVRIKEVIH